MLKLQNITITQGSRTLLSKASLSLEEKEIVGIQGVNGVGKTTFVLGLFHLLGVRDSFSIKGKALFRGVDLLSLTPSKRQAILGREVGFVFQDPTLALDPLKTVGEHLLESILNHQRISKKEALEKGQDLLNQVHLSSKRYFNAYPFQLSGGECQRVMIAIAIANNPSLLIADEPTTALDPSVQEEIMDLLQSLQKKLGMSILLMSHDLDLLQNRAGRILTLENGGFHPYKHSKSNNIIKKPRTLKKPFEPLLEATNIHVRFLHHPAVKGVNLTLYRQEILGIFGENGAGKTTLMKALLQLIPMTGKIVFKGCDITRLSPRELCHQRKDIQMIFQNPVSSLNPKFTVMEVIEDGLKLHEPKLSAIERKDRVKNVLVDVQLDESLLSHYPEMLSGGEAQRVTLARSLILKPALIIFDEPTASLDATAFKSFLDIVQTANKKEGTACIIISHNKDVLNALCHRVIEMKDGHLYSLIPRY
jgi:ABC-type microcin C transport system duplicated ATPase subunit YejF